LSEPSSNALGAALDSVALVELSSIARGYVVLDAIVKKAPVTVKAAGPVTPGKFYILFCGDVASVEESMQAALEAAGSHLLDHLLLPYAHQNLLPALDNKLVPAEGESAGIVEMATMAAAVGAADVALKATDVGVLRMHLAVGIGGKGFFVIVGELADIEAAVDAVKANVEGRHPNPVVGIELIPQPHGEVRGYF
jgi:microcompartment protein CcmL/EutN